jgi:thioredoxin-dependent peroxiredoxin
MADRPGMMVGPNEHNVQGPMLEVGQTAPDFELIANDMKRKHLADYAGKVKVISCVPSLDTGVCSAQTKRFNMEADKLGDEVVVLTVSSDLPFAQKRWCGNEGVERTETLSDHKTMQFAESYGVHDTEWRVLQRACFVLDKDNVVQYVEYIPVIGDEVSFDAVLEKAKSLV